MINEEFYKKVKKMLDEEGEVSDAINRLIDKDTFKSLPYESRERYVLEIGNQYREAKARYEKEKIEAQRKAIEEEKRKAEEIIKKQEQDKQNFKDEVRKKREARKNSLQVNDIVEETTSSDRLNLHSFVDEIERIERENIANIGNVQPFTCVEEQPGKERALLQEKATLNSLFSIVDSLIFLDVETSGLDAVNDRLIEVAALKVINENGKIRVAQDLDRLIRLPEGMILKDEIIEKTGITNEDLISKGESSKVVLNQFVSMFKGEKTMLVAYNAQFDCNFIYWALQREGLSDALKGVKLLDALTIYKDRKPYPHKLSDAVLAYGLTSIVANTHRALDDTIALFEVVRSMCLEHDDLAKYINLFGYNPKYGVNGTKIQSVCYLPQPYNNWKKLYEE